MKSVFRVEKRFDIASGTLFLTVCTVIIKVVGFVYKIPLLNNLGAKGAGLYQIVFPFFSLLIAIVVSGVPSGMTKIIASGRDADAVLSTSLKTFLPLGVIFTLLLHVYSTKIADFQGNAGAGELYKIISLSVLFVTLISILRGYFQGLSNLKPTAISQLIEQLARAVIGILFFVFLGGDYYQKTRFALLAVTLSELFALAYLVLLYLKVKRRKTFKKQPCLYANMSNFKIVLKKHPELVRVKGCSLAFDYSVKSLLVTIFPLTAIGLLSPLSGFIDSVTVINSLNGLVGGLAIELYGSYSGSVQAIIGLPVAILHAFAIGFLPKLSKIKHAENRSSSEKKLLLITSVLAFLSYLLIMVFASLAVEILFGNFVYKTLLTRLLRLSSINVIFASIVTASNLILLSRGKQFFSLISMPFGLLIKTIINLTLLKNPKINIFGLIISDAGCYFVALFLNLLYIIYCNKKQKAGKGYENNARGNGRRQGFALAKRI